MLFLVDTLTLTSIVDEQSNLKSVDNQTNGKIEEVVDVNDKNPIGVCFNLCDISKVHESGMKECYKKDTVILIFFAKKMQTLNLFDSAIFFKKHF